KARTPQRRAFAAWRQVGAVYSSRKTKAHRSDGNVALVIERFAVELHPFAQAIAGCIIPRDAAFVHAPARRLTRDQNARACIDPHHRPRFMWQRRGANAAGTYFFDDGLKCARHGGSLPERRARVDDRWQQGAAAISRCSTQDGSRGARSALSRLCWDAKLISELRRALRAPRFRDRFSRLETEELLNASSRRLAT